MTMNEFDQIDTPVVTQTIEIAEGDPLVVPDAFQRALGLDQGGVYTVIQLDGMVLVTPKRLVGLEMLEGIRQVLLEGGVTLDQLLEGLANVREQIYRERYGTTT